MTVYAGTLDAVEAILADLTETLTYPLCPVVLGRTIGELLAYEELRDKLKIEGAEVVPVEG